MGDKSITSSFFVLGVNVTKVGDFWEVEIPTPNVDRRGTNKLRGIVLHHTASQNVRNAVITLCDPEKK